MRVLRWLLAVVVVLGISIPAWASYTPTTDDELILTTDTIVYGEIDDLTETHYSLRVLLWIRREAVDAESDASVTIRRFEDWECATRGRPYRVGEKLILFLGRGRDGGFRARGAGNEGEWSFETDEDAKGTAKALVNYVERYVPVGAPGWIPVWRKLLGDEDRHLRRIAAMAFCDGWFVNPGCGDFVRDELIETLRDVHWGVRRTVLPALPRLLTEEGRTRAWWRVGGKLPPGTPSALAAAAVYVRPYEVESYQGLLRALSDSSVPLAERRSTARVLGERFFESDAAVIEELRAEFATWMAGCQDAELAEGVAAFVAELGGLDLHRHSPDAGTVREQLMRWLAQPVPEKRVRGALARRGDPDFLRELREDAVYSHLSLADRIVPWDPRQHPDSSTWDDGQDFCDVVRSFRAAVAAEKAGDLKAAITSYETVRDWGDEASLAPLVTMTAAEIEDRVGDLALKLDEE